VRLHAEDANFERMELKIGGYIKVWRDADQTYAWDTVDYGDGVCKIILTVYDKAGNAIKHEISVVVDNTPPLIGGLEWTPKEPLANKTVNVSVSASESGSGIKNATLWFRRLGGEWTSKPMTLQEGNWTCTIPEQEENAVITFYAEFYDNAGNVAKTHENFYTVKTAPGAGFPLYWLLLIIVAIFGAMVSTAYYFRLRKRRGAGPVKYLAVSR
ncbi:MAG: Ig-like domain repeat protein, partial [Candidatus Bathyarchaeales archaeon]